MATNEQKSERRRRGRERSRQNAGTWQAGCRVQLVGRRRCCVECELLLVAREAHLLACMRRPTNSSLRRCCAGCTRASRRRGRRGVDQMQAVKRKKRNRRARDGEQRAEWAGEARRGRGGGGPSGGGGHRSARRQNEPINRAQMSRSRMRADQWFAAAASDNQPSAPLLLCC